eukprot:92703-Karenia_brevis.AAC.1
MLARGRGSKSAGSGTTRKVLPGMPSLSKLLPQWEQEAEISSDEGSSDSFTMEDIQRSRAVGSRDSRPDGTGGKTAEKLGRLGDT